MLTRGKLARDRNPMKKIFQSKSPFIQTDVLVGVGSISPKTTTMVGPIPATLLSTQASQRAKFTHFW